MSAQLVVFCKHRLFRVSKFDFLVVQPASVKFPMNILMLFHDFCNIGRPSDFPGFGCQRPTTKLVRFIAERCTLQTESSWDQHLPKNYAQSNCLAPHDIFLILKSLLLWTVVSSNNHEWIWGWGWKIDAWNHKCLCRESKTILCDLQMMISQFQLHNSTLTFLPIWIHDSSSKKQRHALLTKTSSTDILRCRHVQQTACGVKHRQPTPWAKKKPQPRLSCPAQPSVPQSANQTSCSSNIILLGS